MAQLLDALSRARRTTMKQDQDLLKIGEFARLADTNLRTLRYYEEVGLIVPAGRSQGGFRYYRRTDFNRVQMIRDLQELGLHLDRIRELISARQAGEPRETFLDRVRQALEEQDRMLVERVRALEVQRKKVAEALNKINECRHCTHSPAANNNFCEPCTTTGLKLPEHLSALYQ
jgi:DNA-binding transcriptional MerR regulator